MPKLKSLSSNTLSDIFDEYDFSSVEEYDRLAFELAMVYKNEYFSFVHLDAEEQQQWCNLANKVRNYYSNKILMDTLKGNTSKYRVALMDYIEKAKIDNKKILHDHVGIVSRLPYHYLEDCFIDDLKQKFPEITKTPSEQTVDQNTLHIEDKIRTVDYIGSYVRYTNSRDKNGNPRTQFSRNRIQWFWFSHPDLEYPICLKIESRNPFFNWFKRTVEKQGSIQLKVFVLNMNRHPDGVYYLNAEYWDLES